MNEHKKIEPTDTMVEAGASYAWEEANPGILGWNSISELHKEGCRRDARAVLTASLNHPDAAGLFADEDTIRAAHEEGWDQATLWIDSYQGGPNGRTSSARAANPYRPVQELPPERDGVALVPADGHKAITTTKGQEFARLTFTTKQDLWYGPNLAARPGDWVIQTTAGDRLTPGTWQVDDQ